MNEPHLSDLLRVLQPALKSQKRAKELLERFWQDKAAIIWTTTQVHRAANESKTVLTEADAQSILHNFISNHHYQYGLCFTDLVKAIEEGGLGRRILSAETRNLVLRNTLTVDP
jgi:hypothetical protein